MAALKRSRHARHQFDPDENAENHQGEDDVDAISNIGTPRRKRPRANSRTPTKMSPIQDTISESNEMMMQTLKSTTASLIGSMAANREEDRQVRQQQHEVKMQMLKEQAEERRREADERRREADDQRQAFQLQQQQMMALLQMLSKQNPK